MQFYNNQLCISFPELVNKSAQPNTVGENAFLSRYQYVNLMNSKQLKSVRMGCRNTPALYAFDSLPQEVQLEVSKKFKDVVKSAQQEPVKNILQPDYKALSFFTNYTLPNGDNLKENTIREYTATAAALNAIIKLTTDQKAWRQALGGNVNQKAGFCNLLALMTTFQPKWGWKLPAGEKAVKLKIAKYKATGYASLVSGKLCNDNAAKVADNEQEAILRRIMAQGRNFDDAQVRNMYNIAAAAAGWKLIERKTVANKRSEWQIYTDAGSRGKSNHDNVHAMQTKRRAPKSPLLYWTVDGWDVELLYQKMVEKVNREGKKRNVTEYHHRLTAVVVLDPCGKYPVGYAIGTHETPALIREALRNAVRHTAELFGEMHIVHQLQTDRYGGFALKNFYEGISEVYTPARAHNAKTKVIEPYFKRLNKNHCQIRQNWSGFGVTARKENQPNSEYLNKIRHSFPDQHGCIDQIIEMIEAERRSKIAAYKAAYANLSEEHKYITSESEFLLKMGEVSGKTNRLAGNGVNFQLNNQKFVYDTFDPAFRQHRNEDWVLRFDPADMRHIMATSKDGSLRFMLEEKFEQPMALAERQKGDSEELQKIFGFNKALEQDILKVQQEDYDAIDGLFNRVPVLQETLGKLLIIDSEGQHKNNKSNARLMHQAQRKTLQIEAKAVQQEHKDALTDQEAYLDSIVDISKFINKK